MRKISATVTILTITVAHLVHDIYSSFLAPILPLLINKLGMSYTLAGFLSVVLRLPALLNPAVGILADRLPMRYFVAVTPAVTAVCMSLLGIAPHYAVLIVLLLVAGVSSIFFHIPGPVMVKQVAGDRTGMGMSWFMLGGELARTLAPLVILGGVSLWGLEGTWRLAPFGIAASVLTFFRVRPLKSIEINRDKAVTRGAVACFMAHSGFFGVISAITFFRASIHGALMAFLPTYMTVRGESVWMGGAALSALQLSGAIGTFFWGAASDHIGRRNTLLITSAVSPVIMWGFILAGNSFAIPILVLLGFMLFATTPVLMALVQERDTEHPAFVNSIYITISFIIGSLAVMLAGWLAEHVGLETAFRIAAGLSFGTIPFIFLLDRTR